MQDDLISRQAVLASIKNLYPDMPVINIMGSRQKWLDKYAPYFECENAVEQLPSVTQKSGKWIPLENRFELGDRVRCSNCGQVFVLGDDVSRHFCPNCGAKMESEDEE